jgi:hypothetical protein
MKQLTQVLLCKFIKIFENKILEKKYVLALHEIYIIFRNIFDPHNTVYVYTRVVLCAVYAPQDIPSWFPKEDTDMMKRQVGVAHAVLTFSSLI